MQTYIHIYGIFQMQVIQFNWACNITGKYILCLLRKKTF